MAKKSKPKITKGSSSGDAAKSHTNASWLASKTLYPQPRNYKKGDQSTMTDTYHDSDGDGDSY